MEKIILAIFLLTNWNFVFAQDKNLKSEEVDIQGEFNPVISDAMKISKGPSIVDSTKKLQNVKYSLLDKKVNTTFLTIPIVPAKMKGEPVAKLYHAHIKAGVGNFVLGEGYFNTLRNKKYSFGSHLKHFSSIGNVHDTLGNSGLSNNEINLFGKYFMENHTMSGGFDYNRNVVHYYGYNSEENTFLDKDNTKQRFNLLAGNAQLQSNYNDSSKINHNIILKYYNLNDYFLSTENNINLDARLSKYHQRELFGLNFGADMYNNANTIYSNNTGIFKVNPEVISVGKKWRLKAGFNVFLMPQDDEVKFYPNAEFNYNIIDNIIIPYAGITGNVERNSFKRLTDINPFLSSYSSLQNTGQFQYYAGIRGSLSKMISFNTSFSQSKIQNMALFVNDYFSQITFNAIYDDVTLTNLHGELAFQQTEKLRLLAKADYNIYEMKNELQAWNKPNLEVTFTGNYNLRDKIIVKSDIFYMGKRYANYTGLNANGENQYDRLNGFVDFNLGVEYRYTKHLSAFINFNNITASRYLRWYNYPLQGFNVLGGFTYSF